MAKDADDLEPESEAIVVCLSCDADVFGGSELCATCQDDDERHRW